MLGPLIVTPPLRRLIAEDTSNLGNTEDKNSTVRALNLISYAISGKAHRIYVAV
jgi:hypothetical protein